MLAFQNAAGAAYGLAGLDVQGAGRGAETAKFHLSFSVRERFTAGRSPDGLDGSLEYALDLFDPATAESLAQPFARVLQALVADPGLRVGQV